MSTKVVNLQLNDISVEISYKAIKNIHLSVYPPAGRVKVSAPEGLAQETIRLFVISKLGWIRREQKKMLSQEREAVREYLGMESHYLWGQRYLLEMVELESKPKVTLEYKKIVLQVRPSASRDKKKSVLDAWYRAELKRVLIPLISKWEQNMGLSISGYSIRRMKTKWGSCSHESRTIRINLELVKKPQECLEYIVVHELAHILEPTHNARFLALLDHHLPGWKIHRDTLRKLPVHHVDAWAGES